jgi:hypothetical protein
MSWRLEPCHVVNAGLPDLYKLMDTPVVEEEQNFITEQEKKFNEGKVIGRPVITLFYQFITLTGLYATTYNPVRVMVNQKISGSIKYSF